MSDAGHHSDCPSCGIAVPSGYPRCPKCHAEMPGGAGPSFDGSAERVSGGTSVAEGADSRIWIAAAIGLMSVALVVFLVARGGGDKAAETEPGDEPAAVAPQPAPAPTEAPTGTRPAIDPGVLEPEIPPAQRIAGVANKLRDRLDGARLWSTVDLEGRNALAIRSGYCEDEQLPQIIDALAEELSAAGLVRVTCYERHGAKVFARELGEGGAE